MKVNRHWFSMHELKKKYLRREWKLDHYFLVVGGTDLCKLSLPLEFSVTVYNIIQKRWFEPRPKALSSLFLIPPPICIRSKNRDHSADSWTGLKSRFPTFVSAFQFLEKLVLNGFMEETRKRRGIYNPWRNNFAMSH